MLITASLIYHNIKYNTKFLPSVFNYHKNTCFYCANFENNNDCDSCHQPDPSKKVAALSFEEQMTHIGLIDIYNHFFSKNPESYTDAKSLGQMQQALILFDMYEKGTIKLFPQWFEDYPDSQ